jgi:hypothetical protein
MAHTSSSIHADMDQVTNPAIVNTHTYTHTHTHTCTHTFMYAHGGTYRGATVLYWLVRTRKYDRYTDR